MVLVIFSESLGAAQNFAAKYGYEIDPNQELIALGVANAGSGFVGGLAAGGSLSQSAVNEGAGARSEVSPLVAAAARVVTVLLLTPLFKDLPEAVLAALIIHAVSHLLKVGEFRRYYAERPLEFWLGLATLLGVITLDVLPGSSIGVVAMMLLVVYNASRPHIGVLGRGAGRSGRLRRRRPPSRLRAGPRAAGPAPGGAALLRERGSGARPHQDLVGAATRRRTRSSWTRAPTTTSTSRAPKPSSSLSPS